MKSGSHVKVQFVSTSKKLTQNALSCQAPCGMKQLFAEVVSKESGEGDR